MIPMVRVYGFEAMSTPTQHGAVDPDCFPRHAGAAGSRWVGRRAILIVWNLCSPVRAAERCPRRRPQTDARMLAGFANPLRGGRVVHPLSPACTEIK